MLDSQRQLFGAFYSTHTNPDPQNACSKKKPGSQRRALIAKTMVQLLQTFALNSDIEELLCRWVSNIAAFVGTALLSEWLCLRRELRDIPIGNVSFS